MSAQLLTIFIVVTTVALMIVPMNSSNGNLYNVETAINEDDNKFSFNLQLLDWHVGYNKFTVAQYAETPLDLKNLCGLPLLCGSPCEDPCETLASCGQAFIAILSFAVGMLFLGVFFLLLDFFGLAPCGVNKLTGVLLWLGMLANFISCMVFLGSIGVTVAGHDDGKNTEYYFLPGLPPTGFQPSAGAICHYISLLTGVIGASLFRSAANGEAGSRGKGVQMSASIMSPSFRFANPTKSQTAKRPSSVKRHGSAKKPTVRGGHSYV